MNECFLWCDGMWGWKEYIFVFVPVICVIVFSFIATWIEEGNIIIAALIGLGFGLLVNVLIFFVPYVLIFIIGFFSCVFIGWLLAELVKKIERKQEENSEG